jgi:hypothetical protein
VLKSRSRAAILAAGLALATLLVGGSIPWWTSYVHDGRGRYPPASLWGGLPKIFTDDRLSAAQREDNLLLTVGLAGVAVTVGVAAYWVAAPHQRPESAADYADSPPSPGR